MFDTISAPEMVAEARRCLAYRGGRKVPADVRSGCWGKDSSGRSEKGGGRATCTLVRKTQLLSAKADSMTPDDPAADWIKQFHPESTKTDG